MLKDAYHSCLADETCPPAIYQLAGSIEGRAVTEIVEVGQKPTSIWPDLAYVGIVDKFIYAAPQEYPTVDDMLREFPGEDEEMPDDY